MQGRPEFRGFQILRFPKFRGLQSVEPSRVQVFADFRFSRVQRVKDCRSFQSLGSFRFQCFQNLKGFRVQVGPSRFQMFADFQVSQSLKGFRVYGLQELRPQGLGNLRAKDFRVSGVQRVTDCTMLGLSYFRISRIYRVIDCRGFQSLGASDFRGCIVKVVFIDWF